MISFITMYDYHIHTSLCKHASGEMEDYVAMALKKGINEICFTDHIPLPGNFDLGHRMDQEEIDSYLAGVKRCQDRFPEARIYCGIEADYLEGYEKYLEEFLKKYSFDLVIMSLHFIKDWPVGQWVFNFDYSHHPLEDFYSDYFVAMRKGIDTGLFNVIGHFDLIKREGHPVLDTHRRDIEEVFKKVKQQQMAIEINTSGLRKPINETYPALEVIRLAAQAGISFTWGSDAHLPDQVGFQFVETSKQVSQFQGISFRNIKPI